MNRIKKATKSAGASSRLISLWVDVDYSTVSRWNSNATQPKETNLDDIGEILEIDNRMLLVPQGRVNTSLAKALEKGLKRLHKNERIPYEIEHAIDSMPCFEFLVVNKELGTEKFVAQFARKEDAEEYIEKLILKY